MKTINNSENYDVNRGVELMLRKRGGEKHSGLKMKEFIFVKMFSFFQREIHFKIELKVIKK